MPAVGATVNQAAALLLAVNVELGLALTDKDWAEGDEPPEVAVKDSAVGLTVSVRVEVVIVSVTGTACVLSPLEIEIVPR